MKTVRVPLSEYTKELAGVKPVELDELISVGFELAVDPAGEIEVTDIEFVTDGENDDDDDEEEEEEG
jgi:hypothetical protein